MGAGSQAPIRAIDGETARHIPQAVDEYLTAGAGDVKELRRPRDELRLRAITGCSFTAVHASRSKSSLSNTAPRPIADPPGPASLRDKTKLASQALCAPARTRPAAGEVTEEYPSGEPFYYPQVRPPQ